MNFAMWKKALTVIPNVTKEEWDKLDIISKWLISTARCSFADDLAFCGAGRIVCLARQFTL